MRIIGGIFLSLAVFVVSNDSVNASKDEDLNNVLTVRSHNVGQGSCTSLSYREKGKNKIIFIDGGASSFREEAIYTDKQSPISTPPRKQSLSEESFSTPQRLQFPSVDEDYSVVETTPISTTSTNISFQETPDFYRIVKDSDYEEEEIEEEELTKEGLVKRIRDELGIKDENEIEVPLAIVSHPDKDHYNLYSFIFGEDSPFVVQNLVLSGRPKLYIKDDEFKGWLTKIMEDAISNINFPTVLFDEIELKIGTIVKRFKTDIPSTITPALLKEIKQDFKNTSEANRVEDLLLDAIAKMKTWAPHTQKFPMGDFKLGNVATLHPLAINPTHAPGEDNNILRHSQKKDTNTDSIALCIKSEHFSVMVMGDATELTTNRIISNYSQKLDQLKADIYVLAHHGAISHGSNNKKWLKLVDPQYAFISNGHLYGHPRNETYENLKKECKRLRKVKLHKVLTGDKPSSKGRANEGIRHTTTRAILSTLNSGTLTAILGKESLEIKTSKDNVIDEIVLQNQQNVNLNIAPPQEKKEEKKESKQEDASQPLEEEEKKVKFKPKRVSSEEQARLEAEKYLKRKSKR